MVYSPSLYVPRRKPQGRVELNREHPFARNLSGYWLLNGAGGTALPDLTGTLDMSIQRQTATDGLWIAGSQGIGVHTLGNSSTTAYLSTGVTTQFNPGSQDFTVALAFRKLASTVGFSNLWGLNKWSQTSGFRAWALTIGDGNAGNTDKVEFSLGNGATVLDLQSPSVYAINVPHMMVGVKQGTNAYLYVDGILAASSTSAPATVDSPTTFPLVIGNQAGALSTSGAQTPNAEWYWAGFWMGRVLSATEVAWQYAEPFAMLREAPQNQALFFMFSAAAGGGSSALTGSAGGQGVSTAAPTVLLAGGATPGPSATAALSVGLAGTISAQSGTSGAPSLSLASAAGAHASAQGFVSTGLTVSLASSATPSGQATSMLALGFGGQAGGQAVPTAAVFIKLVGATLGQASPTGLTGIAPLVGVIIASGGASGLLLQLLLLSAVSVGQSTVIVTVFLSPPLRPLVVVNVPAPSPGVAAADAGTSAPHDGTAVSSSGAAPAIGVAKGS